MSIRSILIAAALLFLPAAAYAAVQAYDPPKHIYMTTDVEKADAFIRPVATLAVIRRCNDPGPIRIVIRKRSGLVTTLETPLYPLRC